MTRVYVLTELFYPEETSTGHVMSSIARALAVENKVRVLCAQPTYSQHGVRSMREEVREGYEIRRVRSTTYRRNSAIGRILNLVTVSVSIALRLAIELRRGDKVVVVTNPPTLPYLATILAKLKRAEVVLVIHDVFPEVLEVSGARTINRSTSRLLLKILHLMSKLLYRLADKIVVLGVDQAELIRRKAGRRSNGKISVIPIFFDQGLSEVVEREASRFLHQQLIEVEGKCIFQFAGNIGPLQGIEFLTAELTNPTVDGCHFAFIGSGRSRHLVEELVEKSSGPVSIHEPVSRSDAADLHAGCDVIIVSLVAGMKGISVPSRISNALAAGRPVLAIVDEGSAIDHLMAQHDVGWVVRPGDSEGFWQAVKFAVEGNSERAKKGARARALAESAFSEKLTGDMYVELLR